MVLTIDIGNSTIAVGGYCGDQLRFLANLRTDRLKTADEYAVLFKSTLELHGCSPREITGAILASVVPSLVAPIRQAILLLSGADSLVVGPGIKTGLNIRIDDPAQLGTDFVCVSVAAIHKFSCPLIVFEMDTATTIAAINRDRQFIGGAILPGVKISLDALSQRTAQLTQISLDQPPASVVGKNTADSMKSGVFFGTASMIDGMIERYREVLGDGMTAVATGSLAQPILPLCRHKVVYDPNLTLEGLRILYQKNADPI
jgi:type III pantothenate kinase